MSHEEDLLLRLERFERRIKQAAGPRPERALPRARGKQISLLGWLLPAIVMVASGALFQEILWQIHH
ncbi:hypothetical protein G114_16270 [Aeromonas diversa CDC 2478-85]|uniref:Uncharacterized protein n=1 Tax=Aeromonas diversa CDC 2478-85 TaxID=1268237 RepID=N9VHF6_9GAMM|nr:hypothetical protein [Aeromonas diversa]ENY70826.1 hypothetical protein G114_16270 [Aeromonas diversa CDC 2478-85]